MNYEDEDYVRYFTRDTVSWRALKWEGQCVLSLMLHGKFDRSGVFDCDGHDPSHAVTLVTGLPAEVVALGFGRLLESKAWVLRDGLIVWPKFLHAQTCRRSDRARQAESRDNRRLEALGEASQLSPRVTRGHTESPTVTLSLAKPSLAKKRSVSPPAPPKPKVERWKKFPPDFEPTEAHRTLATELGVNLDAEFAQLRDHEFKVAKSDPAATLRTWLRNAAKYAPPGSSVRRARAPMQGNHGLTGFEGTHLTGFEGTQR